MSDSSPTSTDVPDESKPAHAPAANAGDRRGRFRKGLIRLLKSGLAGIKGGLTGIITGIVSGAMVAFFLAPTGQATWIAVRHSFTAPSCTNPQWLLQVPDSQVFASAYYEQRDRISNYGLFHVASNTVDGDMSTSWLQSWPSATTHLGQSSSDYIEWSFAQSYRIRLICIVDGWAEDTYTYTHTLPIGAATVYSTGETVPPESGSPSPSGKCGRSQASFHDYMHENGNVGFVYQWQPISIDCATSKVVLRIDSVSKASLSLRQDRRPASLAGLSEIKFYYCPSMLCGLSTS